MEFKLILQTMIEFIKQNAIALTLAFGFIVYQSAQWWNGRNIAQDREDNAESRAIKVANERAELYEKRLTEVEKEWESKFSTEHDKVVGLEKALELTMADKDRYLKILENRNPEIENLMKLVAESLKQSGEAMMSMKNSFDAFSKSHEIMMKTMGTTNVSITHPKTNGQS